MALTSSLVITMVDTSGRRGKATMCIAVGHTDPTAAHVAAIRASIDTVSDAMQTAATIAERAVQAGGSAASSYAVAGDYVLMRFLDANGRVQVLRIPSPKESIFLSGSNGTVVDAANATVIAYVASMIANVRGANNVALVSFVGGKRMRRRVKRTAYTAQI